ncbi:hypothetical protein [Rhodococcus aetherivorans]|uniref:hypothetical protein n=1 Tax=Rhodococcus aetherivorans TaxID=191292 RepID=UPI001E3EE296|nr:hypothetical protein [Rhodococcus aetherivorans]UGQ43403.1 hypothetical protein LRQ66_09030 [Rhodococcus aetherivorans]
MPATDTRNYVSRRRAAELLEMTDHAVWYRIRTGKLPTYKDGDHITAPLRIKVSDINEIRRAMGKHPVVAALGPEWV